MEEKQPNHNENIETPVNEVKPFYKNLKISKRSLLILCAAIIIILIISLSALALFKPQQPALRTEAPITIPTTSISFLSELVEFSTPTAERTIDFIVDTNTTPVKGLLLYLEYNPKYVEMKKFSLNNNEGSFFGPYAQLAQLGLAEPPFRTTVSIIIPKEETPKSGRGSIGSFTFEVKDLLPNTSTTIDISPDSAFITGTTDPINITTKPLIIRRTAE